MGMKGMSSSALVAAGMIVAATTAATASESDSEGKAKGKTMSVRKLVEADRILIIGHRGASAYAPENTLAAFKLAVAMKADLVEDDYHVTKDDRLIVIHDSTVDRTTDAIKKWGGQKIAVKSKTLAELRTLDAGSWKDPRFAGEKLPTFGEAARTMLKGSVPLLEQKSGSAKQTLAELKEIDAVEKVVVQSFNWQFLRQLHDLEPKIVLGALGNGELTATRIRVIMKTGAGVVGWEHKDLNADAIQRIHAAGMRAWAWTVDDEKDIRRLVEAGIDGIITNRPDNTRRLVKAMRK